MAINDLSLNHTTFRAAKHQNICQDKHLTLSPKRQTKQLLFVSVEWCTDTCECVSVCDSVSVFGKEKKESKKVQKAKINCLWKTYELREVFTKS